MPSYELDDEALRQLIDRLGEMHVSQRLGIELEKDNQAYGPGIGFFHIENWYSIHGLIRGCLRVAGLLGRGRHNTRRHAVRNNRFVLPHLPPAFEGFRLLHLSDLHVDMDAEVLDKVIELVSPLEYDLCVLTGDYRKNTFGDVADAIDGMQRLRAGLHGQVVGVLGNHDSLRMVPPLESMGYRILLNEHVRIGRDGGDIYVVGVDDAHYFRLDSMPKAAEGISSGAVRILLCHTPEVFRQAAHAGFDVFLCGHTHGGQICLPGGIPLTLDADCPRFVGRGPWNHLGMQGYTSVGAGTSIVNVRLNCPPEITLHTLSAGQ
jgi:predicted MPP superfamily phosphohydrolase